MKTHIGEFLEGVLMKALAVILTVLGVVALVEVFLGYTHQLLMVVICFIAAISFYPKKQTKS